MNLALVTAHAGSDSLADALASWGCGEFTWCDQALRGGENFIVADDVGGGMLDCYERGRIKAAEWGVDVIAALHDDFLLTEPHAGVWERVLREFDDPTVGLVGFGGALVHGSPDLYRTPYELKQLGRSLYRSNVEDAEVHGERFEGACDVAVLDGFALVVRRELLERAGGWPVADLGYIAYDYWIACMAHRLGYRVRLVGVRCLHLGGRTAVLKKLAPEGEEYERAHRWCWETFPDVLPFDVRPR